MEAGVIQGLIIRILKMLHGPKCLTPWGLSYYYGLAGVSVSPEALSEKCEGGYIWACYTVDGGNLAPPIVPLK